MVPLPAFVVDDEGESYRPKAIVWVDVRSGGLMNTPALVEITAEAIADTLEQTVRDPALGPPRRPRRVRVADERYVAVLRQRFVDIEIVVGETPEIDEVAESMASFFGKAEAEGMSGVEGAGYLEGGRLPADVLATFFECAALYYRAAPWRSFEAADVLAIDAPELGIRDACLSVVGGGGQGYGFVLFDSLDAYERFVDNAEKTGPEYRPGLAQEIKLSMSFDRAADLPPRMRRDALEHGWTVVDPAAYPVLIPLDDEGLSCPPNAEHYRMASACCEAVAVLVGRHADLSAGLPLTSSTTDEIGLSRAGSFTVRIEAT